MIGGEIRTLMISARPFASSRFGREARKATSINMYSGCQKAPMKFFPRGVSMAVFPPTAESTMARREVGICTTGTPRMLGRVSGGGVEGWVRTRWPRRSRRDRR